MRLPSFRRLLVLIVLCPAIPALALTPVAARHGMVVSNSQLATDAGLEILESGGNAVDAAVAVGFALAVTYPFAGNIGGGGFMMIRMDGEPPAMVDYREEAPGRATRDMYLDKHGHIIPDASIVGARAVGVPGTVAGLATAEQKYGKLGLARVMQPAIRLAKEGFPVSYYLSQSLLKHEALLSKFVASRRIFLHEGNPYQPGQIFKQPELAYTLEQIALHGPNYFYLGRAATDIVNTMKEYDGIITMEDLARYHAIIRKPLVGQFRGDEILAPPPPSSGGVALIEMLNILGPLDLGPPDSYQSVHLTVEAMRRAYADRAAYMGDEDFTSVPVKGLTSPQYAGQLRDEILKSRPDAKVRAGNPAPFEGPNTTHFSVVDQDGNAVSNTYTLNNGYGSGVTVESAGFLLNDEMDDFTSKPGSPNMFGLIQSEANAIAPHKRPLSSMTPVIVLQGGQVRLVLGSPGGGTIINTVLQVLLNVVVYNMDVLQAVAAPRLHDQWEPDQITYEKLGFSADTLDKLRKAGYTLHETDSLGECEAIAIDPRTGWRFGAADPRGTGKAAGY